MGLHGGVGSSCCRQGQTHTNTRPGPELTFTHMCGGTKAWSGLSWHNMAHVTYRWRKSCASCCMFFSDSHQKCNSARQLNRSVSILKSCSSIFPTSDRKCFKLYMHYLHGLCIFLLKASCGRVLRTSTCAKTLKQCTCFVQFNCDVLVK